MDCTLALARRGATAGTLVRRHGKAGRTYEENSGKLKLTGNLHPALAMMHRLAPSLLWRSSGYQTGVEAELPPMHLKSGGPMGVKAVARSKEWEEENEESSTWSNG